MPPLPSAHDDVAQAVEAKWNSASHLVKLVPGGLQQGRLSSGQPGATGNRQVPFASFTVAKAESFHQTIGPYLDQRLVTIEVRGLKKEVEAALAYVRDPGDRGSDGLFNGSGGLFNRKTLDTKADFVGCIQLEADDLKQDKDTRAGEDWWIGTIQLQVMTARPE